MSAALDELTITLKTKDQAIHFQKNGRESWETETICMTLMRRKTSCLIVRDTGFVTKKIERALLEKETRNSIQIITYNHFLELKKTGKLV